MKLVGVAHFDGRISISVKPSRLDCLKMFLRRRATVSVVLENEAGIKRLEPGMIRVYQETWRPRETASECDAAYARSTLDFVDPTAL